MLDHRVTTSTGGGVARPRPPQDAAAVRTLADLPPGTRATVVGVLETGGAAAGAAVARRLEDLGFTPGSVVDVVRRAPLRDPVVYRVKDYEVCLRRAQAACVQATVAG